MTAAFPGSITHSSAAPERCRVLLYCGRLIRVLAYTASCEGLHGESPAADLQRRVDALAEGSRHGMRRIAQQDHARRCQARHPQRAPAGVPGPLRELLRDLPPHLLQPSNTVLCEVLQSSGCCRLQGAPAGVSGLLRELLCDLPPHLLQHRNTSL